MQNHDMFRRHLAELRNELEGWETQAKKLRTLIAAYEDLAGAQGTLPIPPPPASEQVQVDSSVGMTTKAAASVVRRQLVSSATFRTAVREILRSVGRPMQRDEIKDRLAERGIVFGGEEPVNAVSTQLYRARDEFERIPGRGYWFANEPAREPSSRSANPEGASDQEEDGDAEAAKASGPASVRLAAAPLM